MMQLNKLLRTTVTENKPCMIAELSFRKKLCKYFGMNAAKQAYARAVK